MPIYRGAQKLEELYFQGARVGEAHRWDGSQWHKVFSSWFPYEFYTDFTVAAAGRLTEVQAGDWIDDLAANDVWIQVHSGGYLHGRETSTDGTYFPHAFHSTEATSDNMQVTVQMYSAWNQRSSGIWVGSSGSVEGTGMLFQMHTTAGSFSAVVDGTFHSAKTYTGANAVAGDYVTLRKEVIDGVGKYTVLINGLAQDSWEDTEGLLPNGPGYRHGGIMVCFVRSFFSNMHGSFIDDFRLKSLPPGFVSPPSFVRRLDKNGAQTLPLNTWEQVTGWTPVGNATVTDEGMEIPAGVNVTLDGQIRVGSNLAGGNVLGARIVAGTEVVSEHQISESGNVVSVPATEWANDTGNPVVVRLEGFVNTNSFSREIVQSGTGTYLAATVIDPT